MDRRLAIGAISCTPPPRRIDDHEHLEARDRRNYHRQPFRIGQADPSRDEEDRHEQQARDASEHRQLLRHSELHRSHSPNTTSIAPRMAVASGSMWPLLMKSIA